MQLYLFFYELLQKILRTFLLNDVARLLVQRQAVVELAEYRHKPVANKPHTNPCILILAPPIVVDRNK